MKTFSAYFAFFSSLLSLSTCLPPQELGRTKKGQKNRDCRSGESEKSELSLSFRPDDERSNPPQPAYSGPWPAKSLDALSHPGSSAGKTSALRSVATGGLLTASPLFLHAGEKRPAPADGGPGRTREERLIRGKKGLIALLHRPRRPFFSLHRLARPLGGGRSFRTSRLRVISPQRLRNSFRLRGARRVSVSVSAPGSSFLEFLERRVA